MTGATGFLGSHFVRRLLEGGNQVTVLKRSTSDVRRIADLIPELSLFDLVDGSMDSLFGQGEQFDAVVHAAANYGRQGESQSNVFEANALFPLRLLEKARTHQTPLFINIGSSLPRNLNPYALSKAQFMEWGQLLCSEGNTCFIHAALEHFYGPGDDGSKFITHVIRSCLRGVEEVPLTSGVQQRDFLHVEDVVSALLYLLEHGKSMRQGFESFEIGSGNATPVREVVETIHRLCDSKTRLVFGALPFRINEVLQSEADISAMQKLGWSPRVELMDGLRATIEEERTYK